VFLFRTDELPRALFEASSFRDLARGETLYCQGEPVEAVFLVVHGRLQLCTTTTDGKCVPLYAVRPGECVSEAALFAERYCSDAIAETKSRVQAFPTKSLQNALQRHPDLAAEFMALQAKRCNTLRINLELRSLRSARERILQYIQISAPDGSRKVKVDRTLKSVASDLGLTHETFYRTLAQLIEEGVVKRTRDTLSLRESFRMIRRSKSAEMPT
jgi:CRP-like cAMP-binding protein